MRIPHNKPSFNREEAKAIKTVIKSGWIAQGEKVKEFEDKICEYIGLKSGFAVAVSNGTSALFLALHILGIRSPSDEIIIPNYVCSALLNAIFMNNAKPIVVDVDFTDFNITFEEIKKKITNNTKAIIIPHTFGVPADVIKIRNLNIPIIEDCAQALGSRINKTHVGLFGDLAIFSFYATKLITTGQGGMLVSGNSDYINKIRDYCEYDMRRHYYPRFNFQMTDIQAVMGLIQLKKFDNFLKLRNKIAEQYIEICKLKGWDFQHSKFSNMKQNWYRFVIKRNSEFINKLKSDLNKAGINSVIPIEKWQLLSNYLNLNISDFKVSEKITESTISLPIFPDLLKNKNFKKLLYTLRNF